MNALLQSPRIVAVQDKVLAWLKCGITPRRLAFTLALGFAIGCIPLLGLTTGICALVAMGLGLNMPAMQAANWLAMPLQFILLIPFLRFGQWIFRADEISFTKGEFLARVHAAPWHATLQMAGLISHGLLAWLITAGPALLVLTLCLTPLMSRVSRLAKDSKVNCAG